MKFKDGHITFENGVTGEDRGRCWFDITDINWDVESKCGPISVAGVNCISILTKGVHLNICESFLDVVGAFPGDKVLDIMVYEAPKMDDVTSSNFSVPPASRADVDSVADAAIHRLRPNGMNNQVIDASSSS